MAAGIVSSGQAIRLSNFNTVKKQSLNAFSSKRAVLAQHAEIKGLLQQHFTNRMVRSRQYQIVALAKSDTDVKIRSPSPSDTILQFYLSINEKNLNRLERLLSDDCFFEDYSFPNPFQGKKEVLSFLEQLTTSMGQNIEFNVEHICEGDGYAAAVNWHLDWKKRQVPFTRGCSYCELSRDGERLVIKKIQVVIESPIKPGGLALALFKFITSVFDAFPDAAERFLKSPHIIFQMLLKIYTILLQPIVNPLLAWYLKLWSFTVGILGLMLKILQYIAKVLQK